MKYRLDKANLALYENDTLLISGSEKMVEKWAELEVRDNNPELHRFLTKIIVSGSIKPKRNAKG